MPEPPATLQAWLEYQQRQHIHSIELGLARVREVAARLQLLQPGVPVWTVAGTNGKGSTSHAIAAMLGACGYSTGLFTSPHLLRYTERIRIDGTEVSEPLLLQAFAAIEAARGAVPLTFFEYNALAALWVFRAAGVRAIVLEVGLGGRLDATNIIDADVAVICSIGMDHGDWLGSTLDAIGAEKAGILRAGRPVVLGTADLPASVWQRAAQLQCPQWCAGRDFHWQVGSDGRWNYQSAACRLQALAPPALAGAIQYRNAATALAALQALRIPGSCSAEPLSRALAQLQLPGRLQIVPGAVEWLLDVAHNVPAAQVLADALAQRPCAGRTLALFAALTDKDAAGIAQVLDARIDHWVLCGIDEPRGESAAELRARLSVLRAPVELAVDVASACARAQQLAQPGDRVVVFGSFHTVGPALAWLGLY
ncbi:MAG: bifunctional tetrahydrofolate synthase/dihydrofolate synthase [Steroidobacteraceae bacterium]